jgi:hypothetical protein
MSDLPHTMKIVSGVRADSYRLCFPERIGRPGSAWCKRAGSEGRPGSARDRPMMARQMGCNGVVGVRGRV